MVCFSLFYHQVNQVEPPNDEEEGLEEESVHQTANLDDINEQLLLDLQAGIE